MEQETCSRIENNDPSLKELGIGYFAGSGSREVGTLLPRDSDVHARVGRGIGNNTHLMRLLLVGNYESGEWTRAITDGIKRNDSISTLKLSGCNLSEGAVFEVLTVFGENGDHLKHIYAKHCSLEGGGIHALTKTLTKCSGLRKICLQFSNINDELLDKLAVAITGNDQLKTLDLSSNNVGKDGCKSLARLLQDPNSNLRVLAIDRNNIDDSCATILANSLKKNTKLRALDLDRNSGITRVGWNAFYELVCNKSSINDTYNSNHTLERLEEFEQNGRVPFRLVYELDRNDSKDKKRVAVKKILCHHAHFDMKPFFEWNLKVLPLAIDWFDRARTYSEHNRNIDAIILSSIYQFALAMPMQFVLDAQKFQSK